MLVRLLARHRFGAPLSDKEIADKSGLPIVTVLTISQSPTWDGIDLPTMQKFLVGCGVDFCNPNQMKRHDAYLRKRPVRFKYLKTSPNWTSFYEPLVMAWLRSMQKI